MQSIFSGRVEQRTAYIIFHGNCECGITLDEIKFFDIELIVSIQYIAVSRVNYIHPHSYCVHLSLKHPGRCKSHQTLAHF